MISGQKETYAAGRRQMFTFSRASVKMVMHSADTEQEKHRRSDAYGNQTAGKIGNDTERTEGNRHQAVSGKGL